jgi:hypothetical protein
MLFPSLSPELARLIQDQADSLGFPSAEEYLRVVFGSKVAGTMPSELSDSEFIQVLDDLSSEEGLSTLPDDFSRADIYSDHD